MKKIFINLSALLAVLTGCQKNEAFDNGAKPQDSAIKFGVITSQTRALPFGGTADFLTDGQKFSVVGRFADGTYYLGSDNDPIEVTYSKSTNEWVYNGTKFWPAANIDLFAWKEGKTGSTNPTLSLAGDANTMSFNGYTVADDVAVQQDLLVSADTYSKPTLAGSTVLTFKHALTQVVFSAQLYTKSAGDTPSIEVTIDQIEIVNVASQGDLTVSPFGYVAGSVDDKNTSSDRTVEDKIVWTGQSANKSFVVIPTSAISVEKTLTSLTNNTDNAMLMIPQRFAAWDYVGPITAGGAYIRVKALIKDGNVVLWGTPGAGQTYTSKDLYIPVSSQQGMYGEWVWGRKINYVIVFGDPNSGSGGGGWGGTGDDPVLVPIRLDAQLTDWHTYDANLQTANFSGIAANIQGLVDQFITEVNNNPAKKYTANFTVTGAAAIGTTVKWNKLVSADKFNEGTQITINLSNASNITASAPAAPAGFQWIASEPSTDVIVYRLTKI